MFRKQLISIITNAITFYCVIFVYKLFKLVVKLYINFFIFFFGCFFVFVITYKDLSSVLVETVADI